MKQVNQPTFGEHSTFKNLILNYESELPTSTTENLIERLKGILEAPKTRKCLLGKLTIQLKQKITPLLVEFTLKLELGSTKPQDHL